MKKLEFNLQTLSHTAEVLTRSQLKNVMGGQDTPVDGYDNCSGDNPCTDHNDYCGSDYKCHTRVAKPI
jgi:hypothetical protein